jgi:hypothetical protein
LSTVTGFGHVVVQVTTLSCVLIATLISAMIIREEPTMVLVRIMNAFWILAIGGHVAIPILEKLQPPAPPRDPPPST